MSLPTLHIQQDTPTNGVYPIRLTLERPGQSKMEAEAAIAFALSDQEQEDIRWYMEDYLERAPAVEEITIQQIEAMMKRRGIELFEKVLEGSGDAAKARDIRRLFDKVLDELADLRIEISCGITEAAAIPWELMRDPASDSAISLRAKSFVRVQSNPNIGFVPVPPLADGGRIRLLYIACRPGGRNDVELRAVANRLLRDLGEDLSRFEITALRPPTFEQLQKELQDAKAKGRPYHIVHFDGHGAYEDLSKTSLADWLTTLSALTLGGGNSGKHGYLMFEHPDSEETMRPVDGATLGKLLHDNGTPILVLNACQSAMHEATGKSDCVQNVHDEIRAIGSLAQAVIDQGIPAVLGMRYKVYVVTAAQYIGQLYANLAKGRDFGQAASEGRKHLHLNSARWIGLKPRRLQDWFVPVVYEAMPIRLIEPGQAIPLDKQREMDPVQLNPALLKYVPDHGFIGRDETLLALDRAFDINRVVLLHAYAGQGKTTTAIEFARWYAQTGGLGERPTVLVTSFESHTDLEDVLNKIGQPFSRLLATNGIEWHALNDIVARRQLVIQLLRQIPVLWIWDNVEPVAGFPEGTDSQWTDTEQSDLALFLKQLQQDHASKIKLLLTSRRDEKKWLDGIPYRIAMPRMTNRDAANLALNLALSLGESRGLTRETIAEWQPLLTYCQGNPMTLRVLVLQAVKENRRTKDEIESFVEAIRSGEKPIQDEDRSQGRDRSLAASLDYGIKHAFNADELPIIALLHLFQGSVNVEVLEFMGKAGEHVLPVLQSKTKAYLTGLLERAKETGLLTHLGSTYYAIHPALPWFLKSLYDQHYPESDEPTNLTIPNPQSVTWNRRTWVEAIGVLSEYYHRQYGEGNRDVIKALEIEEANLLRTHRLARRYGWWNALISVMQGLHVLYEFLGRDTEWARLAYEIVPDFCGADDQPVPGREAQYSPVMDYRVLIARQQERDLEKAIHLQEKIIKWDRQRAAAALALPDRAELDLIQCNQIRSLGIDMSALGHIMREQGDAACVEKYKEAIIHYQRINDTCAEAVAYFNLGHVFLTLPAVLDLDASEAAYTQALSLYAPNDWLHRSGATFQIGVVHHHRFIEKQQQGVLPTTVFHDAQAAERHYVEALRLLAPDAIANLGPIHSQLGNFYDDVGMTELTREHYERATHCFEKSGNCFSAGNTRYNISVMYYRTATQAGNDAQQATTPVQQAQHRAVQRELLERAKAYAEAALRDWQSFQDHTAADQADAQAQITRIQQAMNALNSAA